MVTLNRHFLRCVAVLILFSIVPAAEAQVLRKGAAEEVGMSRGRLERALTFIEGAVASGWTPGGSVLVAKNGVIVAERAYGLADLETRRPFTTDTICYIASISKPITAAAVMILVDEGKLGLDDPVERYIPAFKNQKLKGSDVHHLFTVRQLLTHTSGLQVDSPLRTKPLKEWLSLKLLDTVEAVATTELEFEPGAESRYSNVGFATLGRVIEVVAGQSFETFVTERLFKPLGMRNSFYNVPKELAPRVATLYTLQEGKLEPWWRHDPDFKIINTMPNGGVFTTLSDLAVFAQMILNGGSYNGQQSLAPATVRMMISDQTPELPRRWGLGWALGSGRRDAGASIYSESVFSHPGGGRYFVWGDPEENLIGVVLLQRGTDPRALFEIWTRFLHMIYAALESPKAGPTVRRSLRAKR
jgi:CubicO group peptidase (beta-lactamase class C family)